MEIQRVTRAAAIILSLLAALLSVSASEAGSSSSDYRYDLLVEEVWLASPAGPQSKMSGDVPSRKEVLLVCKVALTGSDVRSRTTLTHYIDEQVVGTVQGTNLKQGTATVEKKHIFEAAGPHTYKCEIKTDGKGKDINAKNNAKTLKVNVKNGPAALQALALTPTQKSVDLIVEEVWMTEPGNPDDRITGEIRAGKPVIFHCKGALAGGEVNSKVTLAHYINGEVIDTAEGINLQPGSGAAEARYIFGKRGHYVYKCMLDPDKRIEETNKDNNFKAMTVKVE